MATLDHMHICQIMLSAGFGGAERLFVDLCLDLANRGHRISAVCHPEFVGLSFLNHERIRILPLKVHVDRSPLAIFRLKKTLKRVHPQIIHCHLARTASIAGPVGRSLKIPVAANIHNYVKLKYYRKIDFFFPGTQDQCRYLVEKGVLSNRIAVIPHFTRLPAHSAADSMLEASVTFISYGRFVRKKGFDVLLKAFKQLQARGIAARLILGGDGPEKNAITELIAQLNLTETVTLYGWVDDVTGFLARGNAFVLPSLDEPFGIVVLEAMSQGKVVLTTTTQGPCEILNHETAYFFPPGDILELTNTMEQVCRDGEKARLKARRALAEFKLHYAAEKVLPLFETCYRNLIRQKGEI